MHGAWVHRARRMGLHGSCLGLGKRWSLPAPCFTCQFGIQDICATADVHQARLAEERAQVRLLDVVVADAAICGVLAPGGEAAHAAKLWITTPCRHAGLSWWKKTPWPLAGLLAHPSEEKVALYSVCLLSNSSAVMMFCSDQNW